MEKITKKYYLELLSRFNYIYNQILPVIRKNIEEYRKHGDFAENSELKSEIQQKQKMESELEKISKILSSSEVIDYNDFKEINSIQFGCSFDLKNKEETISYQIVSIHEADLEKNKISYKAPIAQKMIGKKVKDKVILGDREYVVDRIYYTE